MNILKTILIVGCILVGYHHYAHKKPETKPVCEIIELDAQELENELRNITNLHRVIITKAVIDSYPDVSFLAGFARPEHFSNTNKTFSSQCLIDSNKRVVFYIRVSKKDPTRNPIL